MKDISTKVEQEPKVGLVLLLRVFNFIDMNNRNGKSKFYGVFVDARNGKFITQGTVNGRGTHIGSFEKEIDAALAYDNFVKTNNFDRRLNFPDPEPENLIPNTRLIRLSQGKFAVVDEADFEWLNQYDWFAYKGYGTFYAKTKIRENGKIKEIKMHQMITGTTYIDHANSDGIHNYRSNLRPCTSQQNNMNQRPQKNKKSIYKGVYPVGNRGRFRASIRFNGKAINLGSFYNEIEAAKAYDRKAKELFGEFAWLNFPNLP